MTGSSSTPRMAPQDIDRELIEGRRLMEALLPDAREKAQAGAMSRTGLSLAPRTLLGTTLLQHLREENLDALLIYEDQPGAWYADIVFRDMPMGVPDRIGTPVADPLASRAEAEKSARSMLETILAEIFDRVRGGRDLEAEERCVFVLGALEFSIPVTHVARMAREIPIQDAPEDPYILKSMAVLDHILFRHGETIDAGAWVEIPESERGSALLAMIVLLSRNIFRHPSPGAPDPGGRTGQSS